MKSNIVHKQSLYRFTYAGCWVIGGLGMGFLTYLDHPVLGVLFYIAMILGSRTLKSQYRGVLFDQRDGDHDMAASQNTLAFFGKASAVTFPVLIVLSGFGYFTWTPFVIGVASTLAAIFIVDTLFRISISLQH